MWKMAHVKEMHENCLQILRITTSKVYALLTSKTLLLSGGWEDFLPTQGHVHPEQRNHTQEFLPTFLPASQLFIQCSSCWNTFKC